MDSSHDGENGDRVAGPETEVALDNKDPKQTGRVGGLRRAAKMAPAARKAVAPAASRARWEPPRATHTGVLKIGDIKIDCAVIDGGRRVISDSAFQRALGRSAAGGQTYQRRRGDGQAGIDQLPIYVALRNL